MPRRKRDHIPLIEKLASILADQLPTELRDELREKRVPASQIVRLFTPDHVVLHAWGGEDRWWNLTMRLRDATLKRKDAQDTSRAAKAKRIDAKWESFMRDVRSGRKPKKSKIKSKWPSRPFAKRRSRPWR